MASDRSSHSPRCQHAWPPMNTSIATTNTTNKTNVRFSPPPHPSFFCCLPLPLCRWIRTAATAATAAAPPAVTAKWIPEQSDESIAASCHLVNIYIVAITLLHVILLLRPTHDSRKQRSRHPPNNLILLAPGYQHATTSETCEPPNATATSLAPTLDASKLLSRFLAKASAQIP